MSRNHMNYWLKNETLRRCLFPLAFVCIFIVWRLAEHGVRSVWVYLLLTVGVICLALDRVFKPWEDEKTAGERPWFRRQ